MSGKALRLRFGVRTWFVACLVVACALVCVKVERERAQRKRDLANRQLREAGIGWLTMTLTRSEVATNALRSNGATVGVNADGNICSIVCCDEGDLDLTRHLRALSELRELDLSWSQVTDDLPPGLELLPSLNRLVLDHTPLTDVGLLAIAELKSLRELSIVGVNVSDSTVEFLGLLRPDLLIEREE